MTEDVRKLLGGYATGNLSEKEQQTLFAAALQDDQLFAALADEHALKELLEDSAVRAEILRATDEPRFTISSALRQWFERPKSKALVATGAVLLAVIGFQSARQGYESRQVAGVRTSAQLENATPVSPQTSAPASPPPEQAKPAKPVLARRAVEKPAEKLSAEVQAVPPVPSPSEPQPKSSPKPEAEVAFNPPPAPATAPPQATTQEYSMRLKDEAAMRAPVPAKPVQWEILRKQADGSFQPIRPDYQFAPGDEIRVRVTAEQTGAVAVAGTAKTVSRRVTAGAAAEVPETEAITISAETNKLVLSFTPTTFAPQMRRMSSSGYRGGVVGGVIGGQPPVTENFISTIEIPIRVKKP